MNNSTGTTEVFETLHTVEDYWQYRVASLLSLYISPILIVIGIIGNILTLIVMQTKSFKSSSTSIVLNSLAISDTGLLLTGLLRIWVDQVTGSSFRNINAVVCKLSRFLVSLFAHLSPQFIMVLTIERLISVFVPLHAKHLCSRTKMKVAILIVTILVMAVNCLLFLIMDLRQWTMKNGVVVVLCTGAPGYEVFFATIWTWIDFVLASLLPSVVILIGNPAIISRLYLRKQASGQVDRSQKAITVTLITVSLCFVLFTSPSCFQMVITGSSYLRVTTVRDDAIRELQFIVTFLVFYLNSSVNFYLYCLTGSKFRNAFRGVFTRNSFSDQVSTNQV